MKLTEQYFNLFDRQYFLYSEVQEREPNQLEDIKNQYQNFWNDWKKIMEETFNLFNDGEWNTPFTENWTNNRRLHKMFWTRLKHKDKQNSSSCIETMISKDNIRIYLEWHGYTAPTSNNSVEDHNGWLHYLEQWVSLQKINTDEYSIWTSKDEIEAEYITLTQFLEDDNIRKKYVKKLSKGERSWIRIGRVIAKGEAIEWDNAEKNLANYIDELVWIYNHTQHQLRKPRKYWLFNVYYSQNKDVWKKCKEFEVAAMQYELGKQQSAAVTRNLKLIKKISVGDYVVAYTGDRGFLAVGEVTRPFFNEEQAEKYIILNDAQWKQRIGVNWFQIVRSPVRYTKSGFMEKVGLKANTVMSSATIFEIQKKGYEFVKRLLENTKKDSFEEEEEVMVGSEQSFSEFVQAKGFYFEDRILQNYVTSLKSKPFVILSGISGTGKTKIAQFFAEYMCPDELVVMNETDQADEFNLLYQIKPYNLKYKRIILPQKYMLLLDLPDEGTSTPIKIIFDGIKGEGRLYNAKNGDYRQLLFKGEIANHLVGMYEQGDYVKITFEKEEDRDLVVFKSITPDQKEVKQKSNRYCFLPVRPDWMDNKSLLGFYNPITEKYQSTELLKLLLRAQANKEEPYFVILDEMNLAKVEYYFSDFLSCLESRRVDENGQVISESIQLHDKEHILYIDESETEYEIPPQLTIPENVYFTGTVNIDETTYMFSPKVLDRANVIEFNEVYLDTYLNTIRNRKEQQQVSSASEEFIHTFTDNSTYHQKLIRKEFDLSEDVVRCYEYLRNLNALLAKYNMHFGYRVVDEILFYLSNCKKMNDFSVEEGMDLQILQRILPKLHGNRKKLEIPLIQLLCNCFDLGVDEVLKKQMLTTEDYKYLDEHLLGIAHSDSQIQSLFKACSIRFPQSAKKLYKMLQSLKNNGFVSFIE
ncbi:HI_0552 family protein [Bacillus cereus]|uniref:HI_0552 family protein n=1 Tax=Bacillus cereus TaxID=1396 RepID=UPI0039DF8926